MADKVVLEMLLEKAGNMTAVANCLGISPQAVQQWKKVPLCHASKLSNFYGIPLGAFFEQNTDLKKGAA